MKARVYQWPGKKALEERPIPQIREAPMAVPIFTIRSQASTNSTGKSLDGSAATARNAPGWFPKRCGLGPIRAELQRRIGGQPTE
jgi:hypothetical protein